MKKLLDSDWLTAVQFKCNTSAKSVTPVQKVWHRCKLHIVILDYDLQKDIEKVVGQWSHVNGNDQIKILYRNSEKIFLECEKKGFKKHLPALFPREFFLFVLLISNHTVFLVQFGINLHLGVFQKAEIALNEAARAISAFWKTHSCKFQIELETIWLPILKRIDVAMHHGEKRNLSNFNSFLCAT